MLQELTAPAFASNGVLLTAAGYHAEAHAWLERERRERERGP